MNGIADYVKECESLFDDVFVPEEEECEAGLAYLESMPSCRGGVGEGATVKGLDYDKIGAFLGKNRKWVSVGDELRKSGGCNQTALALRGVKTESATLIKTRYVKVEVTGTKECPTWHYGVGHPSWFFIDEVIIK